MSRELFSRLLHSPLALSLGALVALLLIALVIVVMLAQRRRRVAREDDLNDEMLDIERDDQFTTALNRVPVARSSEQIAMRVSDLFGEHLWQRVLAVYACREGDENARNLLPASVLAGTTYPEMIPRSIKTSLATQFSWPRIGKLSTITGEVRAEPVVAATPAHTGSSTDAQPDAPEAYKTGPLPGTVPAVDDFLFLPWGGPFGWSGVIVAQSRGASPESLAHYREPLAAIGDKLGIALELEQAQTQLGDSSERSVRFSRAVLAALEEQSPIGSLIKEIASLLNAESASLWRVDRTSNMVAMTAAHGLKSAEFLPLPVGQGLAGSIVQSGDVLALEDAPSDSRCIFPREARESGIASYLGAPVTDDQRVVGVVEVHCSHHRQWTDNERRMLEAAATVVGQLLKSADARGNRLRVESAYLGLSEALQRLKSQDELLDAAVEVLGHALGVSRALVVELSDTGQPEPVRHEYHAVDVRPARGANLGGLLASEAAATQNGKALVIPDSGEKSLITPAAGAELQLRSELAVAVRFEGAVRSIIYLHQCDRTREWQPDEIEFIERVAQQLSLSLMSVRSFEAVSSELHVAKESARQATESGSRIQSLINALPESVLVLDAEGRLNYFNAVARERFGFGNEDIGRIAGIGDVLTSSDGQLWQQVVSSPHPARYEAELARAAVGSSVAHAVAAAPQTRWRVSVAVAPFRSSQGGPVVGRIVVVSDVSHLAGESAGVSQKLVELQQKVASMEAAIEEARATIHAAEEAEAAARNEAEAARRTEAEAIAERENAQGEVARSHGAAQQLLETNRLKSEFIVSAGHEIEASLQPVLGMLELLGQGQYGPLIPEQQEAIRSIYGWARRIKGDVDWLIEYGSARSRRLESAEEQ